MRTKRLTEARCKGAKPADKTRALGDGRDGHGLTLRILPTGSRAWVQRLTFNRQTTNIGLGGYPAIGLKEARELATANWHKAKGGVDPRPARERARPRSARELRIEEGTATLDDCLVEAVNARREGWKPTARAKQAGDWLTSARGHVPGLMRRRLRDLAPREVAAAFRTIPPVMARRLHPRLSAAVAWGEVMGQRDENLADPFARARQAVPIGPVRHVPRKSLPPCEVGAALAKVREWGETCPRFATRAMAMELVVLTGVRIGEAYGAVWGEFDGDVWEIPADRMKAKSAHRVPLSGPVLDVLRRARERNPNDALVFPSPRDGTAMKSARAGETLKACGVEADAHGFRSSFRDWCGESGVDRELAELCLAHAIGNQVEQAYKRSDLLQRRRVVMAEWADYLG